ncbi:kinase [Roseobacter cerasinus]|uniref:Kinase n=1 Tax=Roseobacter cerasinus TaxID=2602289 RepID=A0A640VKQ1_9RHOB|nr:AAA family ATPase [Roseobacter cerasinus]GFE48883.1 kinase [Roseobacter cerasinus]
MSILISLSGLPGVGKTTVAKALAARTKAFHLRVDSVEAALKRSVLNIHPAEDAGYLAISSIAKDNLLLGFDVIADTVNPIRTTRELWSQTATASSAQLLNVEVVCSNEKLHRQRVETRKSDVEGLVLPDWKKVSKREFEPWQVDRVVVDTGTMTIDDCAATIAQEMKPLRSRFR